MTPLREQVAREAWRLTALRACDKLQAHDGRLDVLNEAELAALSLAVAGAGARRVRMVL